MDDFFKKEEQDHTFKNIKNVIIFDLKYMNFKIYLKKRSVIISGEQFFCSLPTTEDEYSVLENSYKDPSSLLDEKSQSILMKNLGNKSYFIFGNSFDDLSKNFQTIILTESQKYTIIEKHLQKISSFLNTDIEFRCGTEISEDGKETKHFSYENSEKEDVYNERPYDSFLKSYFNSVGIDIPKWISLSPFDCQTILGNESDPLRFYFETTPQEMTSHEKLEFKKFLKSQSISFSED